MQHFVMCATNMYYYLPKISSEVKFLILDAYHPNPYLSEKGLFVEAKMGLKAKEFGTH